MLSCVIYGTPGRGSAAGSYLGRVGDKRVDELEDSVLEVRHVGHERHAVDELEALQLCRQGAPEPDAEEGSDAAQPLTSDETRDGTGRDRTGQDRTGEGRRGQERTGEDRTGQD